jgi:hypothetical protein
MKKTLITSVLLLVVMFHGYGQFLYSYPFSHPSHFASNNNGKISPSVRLGLSSTYYTSPTGNAVFGTNISPSVSFQLKPKLQLETGMSYQTFFMNTKNAMAGETNQINQSGNISVGLLYISGIYELNPKTTIRGTAWKQFDLSAPKTTLNPRATNFEAEGFNVGINYKVNDHFQIDASIDYSNGYNPYRSVYNGFGNYTHDPFGGF